MIEDNSEDNSAKHRRWPFLVVWGVITVVLVLALFIARPPETRSPAAPSETAVSVATAPVQSVVFYGVEVARTRSIIVWRGSEPPASDARFQDVPAYVFSPDW